MATVDIVIPVYNEEHVLAESVTRVLAFLSAVVYGVGDWCGGRAARRQPSVVVAVTGQVVSLVLVGAVLLVMRTAVPSGRSISSAETTLPFWMVPKNCNT